MEKDSMTFSSELLSMLVSFFITVLILSYLIGDNPLFRAAIFVFVGVSAGYVASVACYQVLWPSLIRPIFSGSISQIALQAIPLLLSALLLMKVSPKLSKIGQPAMAYIIGVGAAVAVGGAVLGTIFPQINTTITGFDDSLAVALGVSPALMFVNSALILMGVVGTLAYFQFGGRKMDDGSVKRNILTEIFAWIGRVYIAVTFGVLFAGVYLAAMTALIERVTSIRNFIATMLG
jgi:hypothetical protein